METEQILKQLNELTERGAPVEETMPLKERVVQNNMGLVISIAKKFIHSGEPLEDLVQAGYIGLLNAAHNYDLNRGAKFSTYATFLIQGEIRHYIRDKHTTVRVPQWLQKLNNDIKQAEERLYKDQGRLPTISELATDLNIEEDGIREAFKARSSVNYISIDAERREDDPRPREIDVTKIRSKHDEEFPIEFRIKIASAIEKLSDLQQKVVHDIFYSGKAQAQIGEEVGVSQRQISRIKQDVLEAIKQDLMEEMNPN